jgi:hypothetical protein
LRITVQTLIQTYLERYGFERPDDIAMKGCSFKFGGASRASILELRGENPISSLGYLGKAVIIVFVPCTRRPVHENIRFIVNHYVSDFRNTMKPNIICSTNRGAGNKAKQMATTCMGCPVHERKTFLNEDCA